MITSLTLRKRSYSRSLLKSSISIKSFRRKPKRNSTTQHNKPRKKRKTAPYTPLIWASRTMISKHPSLPKRCCPTLKMVKQSMVDSQLMEKNLGLLRQILILSWQSSRRVMLLRKRMFLFRLGRTWILRIWRKMSPKPSNECWPRTTKEELNLTMGAIWKTILLTTKEATWISRIWRTSPRFQRSKISSWKRSEDSRESLASTTKRTIWKEMLCRNSILELSNSTSTSRQRKRTSESWRSSSALRDLMTPSKI